MTKTTTSPSNTYVAMCNKQNFDGFYFRKFTLPERCVKEGINPSWYFLNILNPVASLEKIITHEDFTNVSEEGTKDILAAFADDNQASEEVVTCDPANACQDTGRCWTHSTWD